MEPLLIVDGPHDAGLRQTVAQAAERCGLTVVPWQDGLAVPAPTALLGCLARGARRLPATLSQLADSRFPDVPIILLSEEPLVQPLVLLAGGRISLLGAPFEARILGERLTAAKTWTQPAATAPTLRRSEARVGRGRQVLLLTDGPAAAPADRIETHQSLGLTAILAAGGERAPVLLPEVLPILDAWQDQPESEAIRRSLAVRGTGMWKALVHLDTEGRRWLLSQPLGSPDASGPLVALASAQRIPGWWTMPPRARGTGDEVLEDPLRILRAETGDVVLACSPLPDRPGCDHATLAAIAPRGAQALADHLAASIGPLGIPFAALILELTP